MAFKWEEARNCPECGRCYKGYCPQCMTVLGVCSKWPDNLIPPRLWPAAIEVEKMVAEIEKAKLREGRSNGI